MMNQIFQIRRIDEALFLSPRFPNSSVNAMKSFSRSFFGYFMHAILIKKEKSAAFEFFRADGRFVVKLSTLFLSVSRRHADAISTPCQLHASAWPWQSLYLADAMSTPLRGQAFVMPTLCRHLLLRSLTPEEVLCCKCSYNLNSRKNPAFNWSK